MKITVLRKKSAAFTPEQNMQLAAVEDKDTAALEAFCQKCGIEEMAAQGRNAVAEYFKTGQAALSDWKRNQC
jgi:hypothetical protein